MSEHPGRGKVEIAQEEDITKKQLVNIQMLKETPGGNINLINHIIINYVTTVCLQSPPRVFITNTKGRNEGACGLLSWKFARKREEKQQTN